MTLPAVVERLERHQIGLYLAALLAGGLLGWLVPGAAPPLEVAINPVLGTLLYATFLGIPFGRLTRALKDARFMGAVLVLNFVLVPGVVYLLSRFVARDQALLVGVTMVLLTPCIDYVIVFSGLAGGSSDRLLAAAPVLMLLQMLLLPGYLLLFAGPDMVAAIEPEPFVHALVFLILVPMGLAALTQFAAQRTAPARGLMRLMQGLMVPLMMLTLAAVVGSQISGVGGPLPSQAAVLPRYAAFQIVMVAVGWLTARTARLDVPGTRAAIFSGATRNSLVVLPLALALPAPLELAAAVVVTQTLVELIGMVVFVRLIPRLVPAPAPSG